MERMMASSLSVKGSSQPSSLACKTLAPHPAASFHHDILSSVSRAHTSCKDISILVDIRFLGLRWLLWGNPHLQQNLRKVLEFNRSSTCSLDKSTLENSLRYEPNDRAFQAWAVFHTQCHRTGTRSGQVSKQPYPQIRSSVVNPMGPAISRVPCPYLNVLCNARQRVVHVVYFAISSWVGL